MNVFWIMFFIHPTVTSINLPLKIYTAIYIYIYIGWNSKQLLVSLGWKVVQAKKQTSNLDDNWAVGMQTYEGRSCQSPKLWYNLLLCWCWLAHFQSQWSRLNEDAYIVSPLGGAAGSHLLQQSKFVNKRRNPFWWHRMLILYFQFHHVEESLLFYII